MKFTNIILINLKSYNKNKFKNHTYIYIEKKIFNI